MTRTTTKQIDFGKLERKLPESSVVAQLMMACNDLTDANRALSAWRESQEKQGKSIGTGTGLYYLRIHLSHLFEGMKVLQRIKSSEALNRIVESCNQHTKDCFTQLCDYLKSGSKHDEFHSLVGKVRHSLTFHYDESGKQIRKAIRDRASRPEANLTSITRGNHAHLWEFNAAHDIVNSIMVRQIWKIPQDKNVIEEINKISDKVFGIQTKFMDFSGEFVWRYCSSR